MTASITVTPITIDASRFNGNKLKAALKPMLLQPLANTMRGDFESHVAHYTESIPVIMNVRQDDGEVGVSNKLVDWINFGTQARTIRARDGGVLAFQVNYSPKTQVGVIPSRPGGPSGPVVFARAVNHPGIAPRRVDLAVQEKNQPVALRLGNSMIRRLYG